MYPEHLVLIDHLGVLEKESEEISARIATTRRMIGGLEGFETMSDEEVFEQLKRDFVGRSEEAFGAEARELYGDDVIDRSNERLLSMDRRAWDEKDELDRRVKETLVAAMGTDDPASAESRECAGLHARWIRAHWGDGMYPPEAHVGLAQSYLPDPRFIAYYDGACGQGATEFLVRAIAANFG